MAVSEIQIILCLLGQKGQEDSKINVENEAPKDAIMLKGEEIFGHEDMILKGVQKLRIFTIDGKVEDSH